jgi:uncharacterized protein
MNRIAKAYEARFRALLQAAGARRLDQGVQWLVLRAKERSAQEGMSTADSLTRLHERLAARLASRSRPSPAGSIRFFCDAGLGGLARWLRAAGYEALWQPGIEDTALLREARRTSTTILTTDSLMMERRLLRDQIIPALWVPPTLKIPEQLKLVFRHFCLTAREPRCMSCGGQLGMVDKEAVRHRIPPKTYLWLNEYFLCVDCDKLFWRGTHWEKIQRQLKAVGDQTSISSTKR